MSASSQRAPSMDRCGRPRIVFDVRRLYYMTQFRPVAMALAERGAECRFVGHLRRGNARATLERAFAEAGLAIDLYETWAEAHAAYCAAAPDWIVFGQGYPALGTLPAQTRTAVLYHGIGMKRDVYEPALMRCDVRFTEGPHYTAALRARYPRATVVEVGYAKVDPLFRAERLGWPFDLAAAGLDPSRPTVLFAPTHAPSCFPNMSDRWPRDFAAYNLIVKPHENSYVSSQRHAHRRKMARWRQAPNVYVAAAHEYDPIPFMRVADLLISDASSVLFEFAATDRPVVWCDFLKIPLRQRWLRRWRGRLDPSIAPYADVGAHAGHYDDLLRVVQAELATPARHAAGRRRATTALIGPTDGRVADRIADHLLQALHGEGLAR